MAQSLSCPVVERLPVSTLPGVLGSAAGNLQSRRQSRALTIPFIDRHLTRRATTKLSVRRQTDIEHMYVSIGIDGDQGRVVGPTTEPVRVGVDLPVGSDGDS